MPSGMTRTSVAEVIHSQHMRLHFRFLAWLSPRDCNASPHIGTCLSFCCMWVTHPGLCSAVHLAGARAHVAELWPRERWVFFVCPCGPPLHPRPTPCPLAVALSKFITFVCDSVAVLPFRGTVVWGQGMGAGPHCPWWQQCLATRDTVTRTLLTMVMGDGSSGLYARRVMRNVFAPLVWTR
jgi:hypothetical protein